MTEPKLIQVPGIPGNLREQTLDEFLAVLEPTHLARQQLNEIRNQALKSVELSTQLMQANEKVIELQGRLMAAVAAPTLQINTIPPAPQGSSLVIQDLGGGQGPEVFIKDNPRSGPAPKAECPNCKKMVSTAGGPWASHQRNAHPDNQAPRPTV